MGEKLRNYQVIDVFSGGTFYKVRHKVTNNIFAWKAHNCYANTDEQIQNVVNEVKTISETSSDILLRYYDTILHAPTKTLYFVHEYVSWQSLEELAAEAQRFGRGFSEGFLWRLLHGLARAARDAAVPPLAALSRRLEPSSVLVGESAALRVNCFQWAPCEPSDKPEPTLLQQAAGLLRALLALRGARYNADLLDVLALADRPALHPDAILYHPTVLTNLESFPEPQSIKDIFEPALLAEYSCLSSEVNKCDSEKVDDLSKAIQPLPRTIFNVGQSPIYGNVIPKKDFSEGVDCDVSRDSLSPTLAALALELPGFVPRSRRPVAVEGPGLVVEETFSRQWLARLAALRRREESLNQRERDIIHKEIVSSPGAKVISLDESRDALDGNSNGITLPPVLSQAPEARPWVSRRRRRRSGSVHSRRRQSCGYEDLDSSLSADAGDGSLVITATKFTKDNLPRRNIFPEYSTKKVHFTAANPFVESDESVTLTFYDLENVDKDGYQVPKPNVQKDIRNFKYLDLEKITTEKRSAMGWSHSSPSKQAKLSRNVLCDISNQSSIRKTPSKSSLSSNSSRLSMMSARSQWSECDSGGGGVFERTRSRRQSTAQTPAPPSEVKKKSRMSLIHFKTPFKFLSKS